MKKKIVIYAVRHDHLLVFFHKKYPEVGYQVPSGTIEPDESPLVAARREFFEETGVTVQLEDLKNVGESRHDMWPFRDEVHHRYFFALRSKTLDSAPLNWTHMEVHPDNTTTEFVFQWIPLKMVDFRFLAVGQARLIEAVSSRSLVPKLHPRIEYDCLSTLIDKRKTDATKYIAAAWNRTEDQTELEYSEGVDFTAMHQATYFIQLSAERNSAELAAHGKAVMDSLNKYSTDSPFIASHTEMFRIETTHESPCYLITAHTSLAPKKILSNVHSAISLIEECGYFHFISLSKIICLLDNVANDAPSQSYTLECLPGTIFCDFSAHSVRMAEMILHESIHNWLNMAINSEMIEVPNDQTFFSPWRKKLRPVVGLIHAALVFSVLLEFFFYLKKSRQGHEYHDYLDSRIAVEQRKLEDSKAILGEALAIFPESKTKAIICEEINRAFNGKYRS